MTSIGSSIAPRDYPEDADYVVLQTPTATHSASCTLWRSRSFESARALKTVNTAVGEFHHSKRSCESP